MKEQTAANLMIAAVGPDGVRHRVLKHAMSNLLHTL